MKSIVGKAVIFCVITATLFSIISISVSAADPVLTDRSDFLWGVCRHSNFYSVYGDSNLEEQIHLVAEMGGKLVRCGINDRDLNSTDKAVKLCNAYGIKFLATIGSVDLDKGDYDSDYYYKYCKAIANRYNGKNGHGKIDFFQLDNEVDIKEEVKTKNYGAGNTMSCYNTNVMKCVAASFKNMSKAIREADTDAKIIINHGWTHTGFLDWLKQENVDYDIVGLDWYADMSISFENMGKGSLEQAETLYEKYGKDIIICETNQFFHEAFDENDLSNWDSLVRIMKAAYSYPYVKGLCVYELCDETYIQKDTYHMEAHFGLIYADKYGTMTGIKPIYYRLQKIMGGSEKNLITLDSVMQKTEKDVAAGSDSSTVTSEKKTTDSSVKNSGKNFTQKGDSNSTALEKKNDTKDNTIKENENPSETETVEEIIESENKGRWTKTKTVIIILCGVGFIAIVTIAAVIVINKSFKRINADVSSAGSDTDEKR